MEYIDLLRSIWFILVGVLLMGYAILDGFDLGIGVLFRFLGKNEKEKRALLNSIGPFWDGNEVWLLTGAGALFASFPHAYATVFSGFYMALMLVLFALIFRAISIEFYAHDDERRNLWEWAFIVGSFLPALLYGVALGNVIVGVPLDSSMEFTGNFFTLLRPFPLVVGLLGLNAILLQGSTYAAVKTTENIQKRARDITNKLWISFIVLFVLSSILAFTFVPGSAGSILAWLATILVIGGWAMIKQAIKKGNDALTFYMSSLTFVGLWGIVGAIHFPNLVKASNDSALSLTIYNASSTQLTLTVMLIIALIGMPLVILYNVYIFKTFKGKIKVGNSY
jgi:cytochrome d ubiquinol oxidase subunit II